MSNPLILEEPFWNRERLVSGVVTVVGVGWIFLVVWALWAVVTIGMGTGPGAR